MAEAGFWLNKLTENADCAGIGAVQEFKVLVRLDRPCATIYLERIICHLFAPEKISFVGLISQQVVIFKHGQQMGAALPASF